MPSCARRLGLRWLPVLALGCSLPACNSTPKRAPQGEPQSASPATGGDSHAGSNDRERAAPPLPASPADDVGVQVDDDCSKSGGGKTYEVGEGKKYARITDVPWEKLGPGATVRIHWRAQPYHEKILIAASGKASAPIRICGVPGPEGKLPVIDGANAVSRRADKYPYPPTQERGLIVLTRDAGDRYGFKPAHVVIQGLEVRNAAPPLEFTDADGKRRAYTRNAAAIFVERGQDIVIRHCVIHGAGNGIFVASGRDEASMSRRILVEHNYVYENGNKGSYREHNAYTEAAGMVYQYNRFGPQREGAIGNNVKDRSAGTVFRYNRVQGGAHLLDLVEAEESSPIMRKEPDFDRVYVYGNVLEQGSGGGSSLIHFGGDTGMPDIYRKGPLAFFHNTVLIESNQKQLWQLSLFRLETADQIVDARNNVFYRAGTTDLLLMHTKGTMRLGPNWISAGWKPGRQGFQGVIEGREALRSGKDPGLDRGTGALRAGSPCVDAAGALPDELPAEHRVASDPTGAKRAAAGKAMDLGAFEFSAR